MCHLITTHRQGKLHGVWGKAKRPESRSTSQEERIRGTARLPAGSATESKLNSIAGGGCREPVQSLDLGGGEAVQKRLASRLGEATQEEGGSSGGGEGRRGRGDLKKRLVVRDKHQVFWYPSRNDSASPRNASTSR